MYSEILQDRHILTREQRRKTLKLELEIRNSLTRLSAQIITMQNELSLLPVGGGMLRVFRLILICTPRNRCGITAVL